MAINFARNGSIVTGVDISGNQIEEAKKISALYGVDIKFIVSSCEDMPISSDNKFDVISASLCWPYFEQNKIYHEVKRLISSEGVLLVSYLLWLASDPVVSCTEKLILKYNPLWTHASFRGDISNFFHWDETRYDILETNNYSIHQEFIKDNWIGRVRGHRAVGGTLNQDITNQFINELTKELSIFPDVLQVEHFVFYHIIKVR